MITAMIKKWKVINDLEHIATTWVVGTSLDSEGMVTNVIDRADKSDMLTMYYSDVEVPIGATYYIQAKRHFNESSVDYWSKVLSITSEEVDFDNILLNGDVRVEQPYILNDKEDFFSGKEKITLRTSKFRSNLDLHLATHWMILDGAGNVLYINLMDKVNKTSIDIDNSYVYQNKSKIQVLAIHVGVSGVESKLGKREYIMNNGGNFEITTNLSSVVALEDLNIKFKTIIPNQDLLIVNIDLVHGVTGEMILPSLAMTNNTITIPWYILQEGSKFKLKIECYATSTTTMVVYKPITVQYFNNYVIKNPEYSYQDKLVSYEDETSNYLLPNYPFHSESMFNDMILIPKVSKVVEIWKFENDKLFKTTINAEGITLLSDKIDNLLIKPVSKSLILIDELNDDGKPTFQLYKYDLNSGKFSLQYSKVRDDESKCLGTVGSLLQVDGSKFIYNPVGTNKLRTYDISTNEVKDLNLIPIEGIDKAVLLRARNNKIFIGNGKDYNSVVYDVEKNKFLEGYKFGPDEFVNKNLKLLPLINGSTLIINLDYKDDGADEEFIEGYESNLEVFNYTTGNFKRFENSKKLVVEDVTTSIVANTGEVIFTKYVPGDNDKKIPAKSVVTIYK